MDEVEDLVKADIFEENINNFETQIKGKYDKHTTPTIEEEA